MKFDLNARSVILPRLQEVVEILKQIDTNKNHYIMLLLDLQATDPTTLWPEFNRLSETDLGIMWHACHVLKKEGLLGI